VCVFRLLRCGFANRDLRPIPGQLNGVAAESITPGKMTYGLFLTRLHDRFLRTGLPSLDAPATSDRSPSAATSAIDDLARQVGLAASPLSRSANTGLDSELKTKVTQAS